MDLSKVPPPTVGRIVHYTVRDGQRSGETRAAIITRTFHQKNEDGSERTNWAVNLTVFPDQSNYAMHEEQHASSSLYDDTGKKGTWRYQANAKCQTPESDAPPAPPADPEPPAEHKPRKGRP